MVQKIRCHPCYPVALNPHSALWDQVVLAAQCHPEDLEVLMALLVLLVPRVLKVLEDPMALENLVGLPVLDIPMLQCIQLLRFLLEL